MKKLSEKQILQITNDINEDMCSATKEELIGVIKYWQTQYEDASELVRIQKAQDNWGSLLERLDRFSKATAAEIASAEKKYKKTHK